MVLEQLHVYKQKNKNKRSRHRFAFFAKINSNWIIELNVKCKTINS